MRVRIQDIPIEGRRVRSGLPVDWVDRALDGTARGNDPGATVDVRVDVVGAKVLIQGDCEAAIRTECSRCLRDIREVLAFSFTHVLEPRPGGVDAEEEEVELTDDDLDVSYIEGFEFELDDIIREHLLLALPMVPLCREECLGLCGMCGADKNVTDCDCSPPVDPRWAALDKLKL